MNYREGKKIFRKCHQKSFSPQHIVEVGVYLPETSNIIDFIKQGIRTTLVEPDPNTVEKIQSFFKDFNNITLHPVAVFDHQGTLTLVKREASTFASELSASPALINDKYTVQNEDKFDVPCVTFDQIDDGSIDLLSVDIEGSEWYVIKFMKSRPKVLSIETHGKLYVNPFLKEILNWIKEENYQIWYKDRSDTIFVKNGTFKISPEEKIALVWKSFLINFRRFRKKMGL